MSASQSSESAASSLAEIRRRQGQVVEAVLVPAWYWWVVTAGMIAIGAAADSKSRVVLAVAIPVAVVVIAALTGGMIFGAYRGVRVNDSELLGGRGAVAIVGLVAAVVGVTLAAAFSLRAAGAPAPATIGTVVGGVVLVLAGPWLMRCLRRIMLSQRSGTAR